MLVADPARWEHERGPYCTGGAEGMDLIRVGGRGGARSQMAVVRVVPTGEVGDATFEQWTGRKLLRTADCGDDRATNSGPCGRGQHPQ